MVNKEELKILEDVVSLGNNDSVKLKDSTNKLVSIILNNYDIIKHRQDIENIHSEGSDGHVIDNETESIYILEHFRVDGSKYRKKGGRIKAEQDSKNKRALIKYREDMAKGKSSGYVVQTIHSEIKHLLKWLKESYDEHVKSLDLYEKALKEQIEVVENKYTCFVIQNTDENYNIGDMFFGLKEVSDIIFDGKVDIIIYIEDCKPNIMYVRDAKDITFKIDLEEVQKADSQRRDEIKAGVCDVLRITDMCKVEMRTEGEVISKDTIKIDNININIVSLGHKNGNVSKYIVHDNELFNSIKIGKDYEFSINSTVNERSIIGIVK